MICSYLLIEQNRTVRNHYIQYKIANQEVSVMKRKTVLKIKLILILFLIPVTGIFSQELTEVSSGYVVNRKKMIQNLENQIRGSIQSLEKYHESLKVFGRIDSVNQTSIAMTSMVETPIAGRDQFIYTENAVVLWKDAKIANVAFNIVKGRAGGDFTQKKRYSLLEEEPHKEGGNYSGTINLLLNMREKTENGNWESSEFRFSDIPKLQSKEMSTYNGVPMKFLVVYVDNLDSKIEMLREYLGLLRLLELRTHKAITDAEKKQKKQMENILGSF